jgi:hypothetical protein
MGPVPFLTPLVVIGDYRTRGLLARAEVIGTIASTDVKVKVQGITLASKKFVCEQLCIKYREYVCYTRATTSSFVR